MVARSHKNGHNIEYQDDKWIHSNTNKPITMADILCDHCSERPVIIEILGRPRDVDYCIAPLVRLLNDHGMITIASCCGHKRRPASIVLENGREIVVFENFDDARKIDKLFPPIHGDL